MSENKSIITKQSYIVHIHGYWAKIEGNYVIEIPSSLFVKNIMDNIYFPFWMRKKYLSMYIENKMVILNKENLVDEYFEYNKENHVYLKNIDDVLTITEKGIKRKKQYYRYAEFLVILCVLCFLFSFIGTIIMEVPTFSQMINQTKWVKCVLNNNK